MTEPRITRNTLSPITQGRYRIEYGGRLKWANTRQGARWRHAGSSAESTPTGKL